MLLNRGNTVFYSTANAGYATFAATSLLAIRKFIPDAQLYILSSKLSDNERRLLDKNSIKYHELDLSDTFTKTWEYPIDCYYLFFGPEFFLKQGFEYSVYIDGDILCKNNPLEGIDELFCVAGVESSPVNGVYTSIFSSDWVDIKKVWDISENCEKRVRINAGVVYFNNKKMLEIELFNKAGKLFKQSLENNIPRKGDDSLFSLFQYVYLKREDVLVLPPKYNYVLQFNKKWTYPIPDLIFFHFSIDKPWKKNPYSHHNPRLNIYNPYVREWRRNFLLINPKAWWYATVGTTRFLNSIGKLVAKTRKVTLDFNNYRSGLKRSIRTRRRNYRKDPLKIFWWRSEKAEIKNFGDEITTDIIDSIFGYRSQLSSIDTCQIIGTGSILEIAVKHKLDNVIDVWGSGFIKGGVDDNLDGLNFFAVRGYSTLDRVGNSNIAVGDPGLLVNLVYKRSSYQTQKIGLVAHYADADLPIVRKIKSDPRFLIIDPTTSPSEVARNITSCSLVLSSSLHGLIFADSYNIPNIHVKLSDRLSGGTYKFIDYYSSIEKEYESADISKIFEDKYLESVRGNYQPIKDLPAIQKALVESFPY